MEQTPKKSRIITVPAVDLNADLSLDKMSRRVLRSIDEATRTLEHMIISGDVSRETIGCLKDLQTMIKELKKDEKDYLDSLTDEQIAKLVTNDRIE